MVAKIIGIELVIEHTFPTVLVQVLLVLLNL